MNAKGLDFYSRLVDGLLERGITPYVTLYHWDLPQVLEDTGGWRNRDTALAFVELADVVSRRLGDRARHWITHNEPWCSSMVSHQKGVHAPGMRDWPAALTTTHHLLSFPSGLRDPCRPQERGRRRGRHHPQPVAVGAGIEAALRTTRALATTTGT